MPNITVIIPTLNRPNDLVLAVKSVIEQTLLPKELIIIDQSSDSKSSLQINDMFSRINPKIDLIYLHDVSITSLVAAKNLGVSKASGDIVSFLEDDVVLESHYIENVNRVFRDNNDLLGCSGIVTNIRRSSTYVALFKIFHRGIFYDKRVDAISFYHVNESYHLIESTHLSGGISSYKKEIFEEIKYDLDNPFFYCEDIEFSIRASDFYGVERFGIATNIGLSHYMSDINRDILEPRWKRKTNEFILLYKKNKHKNFAFIHILWLLIGLTLESIYASCVRLSFMPLLGFIKGLYSGFSYTIIGNENIDKTTVSGFGDEWSFFNQQSLTSNEKTAIFEDYFKIFPWELVDSNSIGFDLGTGSGRWASIFADKVGYLHCIDPSKKALDVAKINLSSKRNVDFWLAGVDNIPFPDNSQDFGYSLGVLHHIPNTSSAIESCVKKLKPGAPFLLYLYYALENRSFVYRILWFMTDIIRRFIHLLPEFAKRRITDIIALLVYYPLAKFALIVENLGFKVDFIPLSYYRDKSFYTMRTDARDRFGTPLEQRFTRNKIEEMMYGAGLDNINFSDSAPYWCAIGIKK